ncbi:unnamed protein product [Cuscuta campestris]|uniref:Reverse transcriptase domain-containing protein n=1 Tax=Cuscuta campestris TaxID=132261 RepID=A0A484L0V8_9ASTE|nr:unnamed protein product [Cuscuta campestris]
MRYVHYASAIGSIMYAMVCTRLDVTFALSVTSRYQSNPGESHWMAVKNILKYFRRTKDAFLKDIVTAPVLDYLETVITQEDNAKLSKIPTAEEIREAVWSINPNSAPGPDGFNGSFFRAAWHIIQNDVISATQEFFIGINLPKSYGSTFLSLIPKIDNPKSFGDYRPISLSTFMSKVNTRILADRIQQLLPKIIPSEQTGFQTGMGVDEQILLVEEMVHKIDSKIRGGNVIIKLDMAKAFDNLEWDYIQGILKKLGFSEHNLGLLLANLRGTHISIMINGSPKGTYLKGSGQEINLSKSKFYCGKGIKQRNIVKMENILDMKFSKLPFTYLGAPICKGILRKADCTDLLKHFSKYLDSWPSFVGGSPEEIAVCRMARQEPTREIRRFLGARWLTIPSALLVAALRYDYYWELNE